MRRQRRNRQRTMSRRQFPVMAFANDQSPIRLAHRGQKAEAGTQPHGKEFTQG